jgi:hypothetical protein
MADGTLIWVVFLAVPAIYLGVGLTSLWENWRRGSRRSPTNRRLAGEDPRMAERP